MKRQMTIVQLVTHWGANERRGYESIASVGNIVNAVDAPNSTENSTVCLRIHSTFSPLISGNEKGK